MRGHTGLDRENALLIVAGTVAASSVLESVRPRASGLEKGQLTENPGRKESDNTLRRRQF